MANQTHTDNFSEALANRCVFENIKSVKPDIGYCSVLSNNVGSGVVLEKVCEYFYYNERNKDARDVPDMDIPPELCLELLVAADYLST